MKAALLAGRRRFEIADVDAPEPAPGEALVRVRSVGVCGSDLHFYRGEFPLPAGFCLGHEVSGEVEALGEGVHGFAKGERIALELFTVCRSCAQCRSGNYHLCRSRKANGAGAQEMAKSGGGADIVVETVGGSADTLAQALTLVAPRGRVCMLGVFTAPVQLHPLLLTLREATIVGSNCYNRTGAQSDYEIAIEITRREGESLRSIITHRFPLPSVAEAYETADDKKSGAIKVMVAP